MWILSPAVVAVNSSGRLKGCPRGAKPLFLIIPPLLRYALLGEGDKGGEVNDYWLLRLESVEFEYAQCL